MTFPLNCELGLLGKSIFELLHLNERPFIKIHPNELEIVIKSLNKQSEFQIYRRFTFLKLGFKLKDNVVSEQRKIVSNINFTPNCKLIKKSNTEILINQNNRIWKLETPSHYKISFYKQLISTQFLKKENSTSLLIENLSKNNLIEYSFVRV